ncbi:MAG: molecular chaperone HtpG [Myxococcales bacterium]|nr:molecular chaperone HtpG [Myxococcales bacterium]
MSEKTSHSFQAAVTEVLRLVIESLYSNPEIFLRELVSNASDAIDKRRFKAIEDPSALGEITPTIRITPDREAGTLTISDDGIGMSREELMKNLGTVAHSGSKEFIRALEEAKRGDVSLIGQFGVGFYSAFLVADRVEVVSRPVGGAEATRFRSDGREGYELEPAERADVGTDVILHLKEDAKEYLDPWRLRALVRKHSDYVQHPIELAVENDGKRRYERINDGNALWTRNPKEVTKEQIDEFYKHLTHDFEAPLAYRHFQVEGTLMFSGLLFIPRRPPFDLFTAETKHGIRLHVKRVFIMDECEALLPRWLRFVRGVVDSEDLPLNVSREMLQDSKVVRTISQQVVRRSLDMIEELASTDDYTTFWRAYGAVLKEGLHFAPEHRARLAKLCRFESTAVEGLTSLADYVSRMKEGQEAIYYVLGANRALVENSPHLEALKKKGYEVLLLTDPVDAFAMDGLDEFEGKELVSAMEAELDLEEEGDAEKPALEGLEGRIKKVLESKVSEVRWSKRLVDSAACLVLPPSGLPPYLERIFRAQQGDLPEPKRILELNPSHPLILALEKRVDADDPTVDETIELLYAQALLAEGSPVEEPAKLAQTLTQLLTEKLTREG